MPILDPSLMLTLLTYEDKLEYKSKSFLIKMIKAASDNPKKNLETIEASIQFKNDLMYGLQYFNDLFESSLDPEDIQAKDVYKILYERINIKYKADQAKYGYAGSYFLYGPNLRFYRPCTENDQRSWYLTSTKVAVICIKSLKNDNDYENSLKLYCLEIDLMISNGFSIVIVVNYDILENSTNSNLLKIFKTHHFLEIHLILDIPNNYVDKDKNVENLLKTIRKDCNNLESYFYLYSPFLHNLTPETVNKLKKLKQKPFFQNFSFSKPVKKSIDDSVKLMRSNHFVFCKNGFDTDLIFVQLPNVPLYSTDDEDNEFTPCRVSGFSTVYLKVDDYMNWKKTRVPVYCDDEENSNDFIIQYVDFDDLHLIKIGSFVAETLYLTKTASETLDSVISIQNKLFKKIAKNAEFRKESFFLTFQDKKVLKFLTYVSYAYSLHEIKKNPNFSMHKNQIFTALEACRIFTRDNKNGNDNDKGVIYQVETGEGKSCIICLIASILALLKKTVHIASSNITLANRDYHESFLFFQQIGLKSAVLLHENELPVNLYSDKENKNQAQQDQQNQNQAQQNSNQQNQQNSSEIQKQKSSDQIPIEVKNTDDNQNQNQSGDQVQNNEDDEKKKDENDDDNENENKDKNNDDFVYNKDFYPKEFYRKSLFKNSSNMNFSVCGLANENETCKNKANIVFSTFVNFESLYLRLMEASPGFCNDFFKDCSLVIDEADSILIDELTNGTILSRSMKTNGSEVLKYVYQRYQIDNNKNAQEVYEEVKQKFPKCKDLNIEDIKDMFSQIDLVNKPEFQDGKKYSIETIEIKEKNSLKKIIETSKEVIENVKEKVKDKAKDGLKYIGKKLRKSSSSNKNDNESVEDNVDDDIDDNDNDDDDEVEIEEVYVDDQESTSKKRRKSDRKKSKEDDKELKKRKKKDKKKKKEDKIFKKLFHRKVETHKHIVPFDYDHKGVLEPNKEFSGFVQQFIAIKEINNNKKNHNMIIKDVSMNYLYVSHPIFVHLYSGVCGLTGTIGNFYDKKIFKEQYSLTTKKIPRNRPNLRIEYPVILCDDINERNHMILSEVIEFNKKEYPVLVIFQDLNEISALFNLLSLNGIKNINIFDGKDEKIKPDRIAGIKGAVSLGTNVCGRGTDIKNPAKPLHVIITYFTSNARVMNQAFGRTARQGQEGSVRIICLKNEFISPIGIINKDEMETVLADYRFKTKLQREFINKFKLKRPWIFNGGIENQKISDENILLMRKTNININRLTCCNYEFPICMSIQTFLLIQAQKVFSLYNCPNCKYTWILFQKYVREMILESWSIFIEKTEKRYYQEKIKTKYEDFIQSEYDRLINWIMLYLPDNLSEPDLQIVPTFVHIFKIIKNIYEPKILSIFPPELRKWLPKDKKEKMIEKKEKEKKEKKEKKDKKSKNKNDVHVVEVINNNNNDDDDDNYQTEKNTFISFLFAFKPYSLIDESGAKINTLNGEDQDQAFIQDPELIYIRKQPHSHFSILSITERIDDLFNMICKKINEVIGSKIGLKFFLRRTLGGCEFGVCYDFDIETNDQQIKKDLNCLVDKNPLLMFTITVKSMIPILAGILIILLVYIASIAKSISEWIMAFPAQFTKELVKKTVKTVAKLIVNSQIDKFCSVVETFLQKILFGQIVKLKEFSNEKAKFFTFLMKLTVPNDFSTVGDKIGEMLGEKIKVSSSFASDVIDDLPVAHFLKIGFLLLLCFASFMMNFKAGRQSVKYNTKKEASEFDKNQNAKEAEKQNENQVEKCDEIKDHDVKFKAQVEKK